jgi:aminomethyltransferase
MITTDEHQLLRTGAGAWTSAALGLFEVTGVDAHAYVNRISTVDISNLPPGRFAHALLLRDDATILGRVTVYRFEDRVMLLVEGESRVEAWDYLVTRKRGNIRLRDISEDVTAVAVRGPAAVGRISTLMAPIPQEPGDVMMARLAGVDVFAARATRDGPDGLDLFCRTRDMVSLSSSLERLEIPFVSDAAWQLLRLEWGVPRVGIEINSADTPIEAGLEDLVAQGKGAPFPGEVALATRRRTGPLKRLVGFAMAGIDLPPVGAEVRVNGRIFDRVRSVGHSPRLGVIGTTAVPVGADTPGTALVISDGGRIWDASVRTIGRPEAGEGS